MDWKAGAGVPADGKARFMSTRPRVFDVAASASLAIYVRGGSAISPTAAKGLRDILLTLYPLTEATTDKSVPQGSRKKGA
jgi:hypothetical protein